MSTLGHQRGRLEKGRFEWQTTEWNLDSKSGMKSILGRGNSTCKGPEAGRGLMCLNKEPRVAGGCRMVEGGRIQNWQGTAKIFSILNL